VKDPILEELSPLEINKSDVAASEAWNWAEYMALVNLSFENFVIIFAWLIKNVAGS
jgi:hypothetical protein